jgi:diguanylate cyclase (GGDEF)-like protein
VLVCYLDGFKQVNDSYGHLTGNKVLSSVANGLKANCREYDYVARMGGDEFVVVAPGLPADVAASKAEQLRQLARQAGIEVCAEDILSLSVGQAIYPDDGADAEELLAEADRRMYMEKQQQPSRKNRRLHARKRCRVTIELRAEGGGGPIFANLTDISLGGCYVETSAILSPGTKLTLVFSVDDGQLRAEGSVSRIDLGSGVAVQFKELNREDRGKMNRILEFVQNSTTVYDNRYLEKLLKG